MEKVDSVWAKYTDKETFERIVDYESVGDMWAHCVKEFSQKTAIVDGEEYTYSRLDGYVARFRTALKNNGLGKGGLTGILLPNSVGFVTAFLAVTTYGAAAVLFPVHMEIGKIRSYMQKFSVTALIHDYSTAETAQKAVDGGECTLINVNNLPEESTPANECSPSDACAVIFTSGTDGRGRGALLNNRAVMRGVKNGCFGYKDVFGQRYFLILPLTHVFGLVRNMLTPLYTGSSLYISDRNKNLFKEISKFNPTVLVLVPALAEMALNFSKHFKRNMLGDSVKYIICGAAAVPPYLVKSYAEYGIKLFPGYGLTESANLVSGNPESLNKPDSVGIIYEGLDYKVVDGELWLKGVNMMDGYLNDSAENASAYCGDWFKTGDLVKFDDEGFLYIVGRKKDIIVLSNGENVSPVEIETKFTDLSVVQDALVYEGKNENGKQILVLEVYPRNVELEKLEKAEREPYLRKVIADVNETLPSFGRIQKVIIRDKDFERNSSMKIIRKKHND